MESYWPRSREVEKVKPFAERAQKVITALEGVRGALRTLGINMSEAGSVMIDAEQILREAIARGVKGKEPEQ
jgi:hypothetical protein